jgi:hypothetical protein
LVPFSTAESSSFSWYITAMATEFTVFGNFPLEVREMIWAKSVPGRVVTITQIAENTMAEHPLLPAIAYTPYLPHFKTDAVKVPIILRINQESRRVGLRIYHVVFKRPCKNLFYFNPSADTIFLPSHGDVLAFMVYTSSCEERKLIRYIGLGTGVHFALSVSATYGQLFGRWENLESMIIQMGPNLGPKDKFSVRRKLKVLWDKSKEKEGAGEGPEKKIVMQNPDFVFLEDEEMKRLGMISAK